jgi:hypothetical protein
MHEDTHVYGTNVNHQLTTCVTVWLVLLAVLPQLGCVQNVHCALILLHAFHLLALSHTWVVLSGQQHVVRFRCWLAHSLCFVPRMPAQQVIPQTTS